MSKFKVGDKVKIGNTFPRAGQTGTINKLVEGGAVVKFHENEQGLYYGFCVLELVEQKPKTKTVRKYAVVMEFGNGSISTLVDKYTKVEILDFNEEYNYHIVPTLFEDVEVPVETETRWTFICKNYKGDFYPTASKYNSLDQAKSHSLGEAIQKIDDSAEEFEIE
jgi:hypothetical protein